MERKCSTAGTAKRRRGEAASPDPEAAHTAAVPNTAPGARRINVNYLPDELLLGVFAYCSFNELIDVIQHVCERWKRLAHDPVLWHDKEYVIRGWMEKRMNCCGRYSSECVRCRCDKTDEEVVRTADMVPQLRTLTMLRHVNARILRKICRNCPNLTTLEIDANQKMSYSLLSYIFEKCPKIEKLILAKSLLLDQRYAELVSRLEQLRSLEVICDGFGTGPVLLRFLADNCPRLQEIDLGPDNDEYPLEDVEYFVRAKREMLVSASMCWRMIGGGCVVPALKEAAGRLERLQLYECGGGFPKEEAAGVAALGQLHNLRELYCGDFVCFRQLHLLALIFRSGCLPLLQKLHLPFARMLTDDTVIAISQGCPLLRELRLEWSTDITDRALTKLHCLKHLQILDLGGGNRLGGSAVAHIVQLPALRTLILKGTDLRRLQPGLRHLLDMRELRCLDILHCDGIEAVPFAEFPGALVNLRELHVTIERDEELFYKKVFADLQCRMPDLRVYTFEGQKETA